MITCMLESFEERLPELLPILPLHYEELALNKDKVPLDPQYPIYIERERRGELMFMVVRDAGELIGYFIGFVAPGLHYQTCLTMIGDIFYLHPLHRGNATGKKLFKAVEQACRDRGVQRMFAGTKLHLDASWLFASLDWDPCEITHTKWIGE